MALHPRVFLDLPENCEEYFPKNKDDDDEFQRCRSLCFQSGENKRAEAGDDRYFLLYDFDAVFEIELSLKRSVQLFDLGSSVPNDVRIVEDCDIVCQLVFHR